MKDLPRNHPSSAFGVFLWTTVFLAGLTVVFLYLFGQRYDFSSGKILSTGVVTLSASQRAHFFVNDDYLALTPFERLGNIQFGDYLGCLEASGYVPECFAFTVGEKIVRRDNVYLWPRIAKIANKDWGGLDKVQWDPKGRGFLSYDEASKMFWGVNFSQYGQAVYEAPQEAVNTTKMTDALFDEAFRINPAFLDALSDPLSLHKKEYVFVGGQVFELDTQSEEKKKLLASFDKPVEKIIPLPGRDIIIVVTTDALLALRPTGDSVQEISSRDPKSPVFYSSARDEIFWQKENHIRSFWFSAGGLQDNGSGFQIFQ
ncbi:MAG: hypothetical protein WCJ84_03070 [Candidatus Peregrinibacteria bacterium]